MRLLRATAIGILLASVLALGGCKKKKPAVPPPQAQAPTVVTQPPPEAQPPAPATSEPNRPQPETTQPETVATPPETAPAPKPKRKPRHVTTKKAPATPEKPVEKPSARTVINNGGTQPASPQLSASMSHEEAIHQKLSTAQLLEATDYNLKNVTRTLTGDEQGMVQTIRSYMLQSRQATKEGDTDLAYRLAFKAHQLSDELIKRQ